MNIAFDKAGLSPVVRIKLIKELGQLRSSIQDSKDAGPKAAVGRIRLLKRLNEIRIALGGGEPVAKTTDNKAPDDVGAPGIQMRERPETADLYVHDERMTKGKRQKANNAAIDLVAKVKAGEVDGTALTDEQKKTLAGYTGNGGSLVGADGKKGSAYEYYTPVPVASGIWDVLKEMGFNGGKVSDPSAGTGIFGATAPRNALVDAVELDATSGEINKLLNDGVGYSTTIAPFEQVAAATEDEIYDAIVTNVPFGTTADRGGNQLHDKRYQKDTLETYFILRSLEKLKPGGLAAFIVPPRCTSGKGGTDRKLRERASYLAEFMGAYRLPNKVFGEAAADTITDVIFFRKHSTEARQKIEELMQSDAELLTETNVLWSDYLDGKYFETAEGRIRVLGEFKAKDPDKFRDVDRVENPKSVPEIAKLLRKLPDSRIDWTALDAAETMPIEYQEGDTVNHGGQTLEWRDGKWNPLASRGESALAMDMLGKVTNPLMAFTAKVTYDAVLPVVEYLRNSSKALDIPGWLAQTVTAIGKLPEKDRADAWQPCLVAAAMVHVLDENGRDSGVNFRNEYRPLSDAIQKLTARGKKIRSKVGGFAKSALTEMAVHYKPKTGFSNVWLGQVEETAAMEISADAGFEGLKYKAQGHFVSLDDAKALFADGFDPMTSDDWCISADGTQVAKADDYYTGNYGQFLAVIDQQIANAPEGPVKDKLVRQKAMASDRVDRLDPNSISHNLFSPYVTLEEKVDFLRQYVHPTAYIDYDGDGKPKVSFDIKGSEAKEDRAKLIKRLAHYMNHRTITLGSTKLNLSDDKALAELRKMVTTANEQFSAWAKASPAVKGRMAAKLSDPSRQYFTSVEDEAPLTVPGLNPDFKPHGYQNSFARAMGRDFSGINGFDTGLGKTFTALLTVQYVQSIGVKKKTLFVVPNSVLSNWRKETAAAYADISDCLFVGLREDDNFGFSVNSSKYDEDLFSVLENRHRKIFMSFEAFERLRLKDDTISDFERYMRSVDASFGESDDKKKDEKAKGKAKNLTAVLAEKTGAAPFLEDMGVDSIVIDEAHSFKNSAETVEFTGAKYLSVSPAAKRGLDAQAKCWFVRDLSPRGDGVLSLTATPLTNSPLEIYSMLSLAAGHDRMNDMFGGIEGADAFMNAVCDIEDEEDVTIDGEVTSRPVFKGLRNAAMLRRALHQIATVKDSDDVGAQIFVPDADEQPTPVSLPDATFSRLSLYKNAYRFAMDSVKGRNDPGGSEEALAEVMEYFGEPPELVGHPFNLINKMNYLIADPDLDKRQTRYVVPLEADRDKLVKAWNDKKHTDERGYIGPTAMDEDILSKKAVKNKEGDITGYTYKIRVRAWAEGNEVCIDSMTVGLQEKFEAAAEKAGVNLDVTIPPKLAAMLQNFQKEHANPRGMVGGVSQKHTKQIIFCDILSWHNKIRRLLVNRCGLRADQIAIVTGQRNNSPEDILDVQNEFNQEEGKYRVIIANKKAEVGINLQKGTQATHHLTIGWTPDSLKQRNGRSVRQGNATGKVSIYHYDANGTFDEAKRTLVGSKADWIGSLMDNGESDRIEISGGMSREKMEALIEVFGDDDGVAKLQAKMDAKEAEERAQQSRDKQIIAMETIQKQNEFLDQYADFTGWVGRELGELLNLRRLVSDMQKRIEKSKSAKNVANMEMRIAEAEARMTGIRQRIDEAADMGQSRGYGANASVEPMSADELVDFFIDNAKRGESSSEDFVKAVKKGYVYYRSISVTDKGDSELKNEWQAEVDMATELREQAVESYESRAKHDGNTPAGAARALADGTGQLIGETPVFDDVLIVEAEPTNAEMSVLVVKSGKASGYWNGRDRNPYRVETLLFSDEYALVYPGTAKYDELIAAMAKFEDDGATLGRETVGYSSILPAVAELRTVETPITYNARYSQYGSDNPKLPAPHFPMAISEAYSLESDFLKAIYDEQKEIILNWDGNEFTVNQSTVVERVEMSIAQMVGYFRTRAEAKRIQLTTDDMAMAKTANIAQMRSDLDGGAFKAHLLSLNLDSEDAVTEAAKKYIADLHPWFNFEGEELEVAIYARWAMTEAYSAARKLAAEKAAPEGTEPSVADEPVTPAGDHPETIVGIGGETREHKETIKEYAKKYPGGGYAKWDRRGQQWKMKLGAFNLLKEELPHVAAALTVNTL